MEERGMCEVEKNDTEWSGSYSIGVVRFGQKFVSPPHVQLTASQEGRPNEWVGLLCTVLKITEEYLIIDFDGWKVTAGGVVFCQEVYPGAKCYWTLNGEK